MRHPFLFLPPPLCPPPPSPSALPTSSPLPSQSHPSPISPPIPHTALDPAHLPFIPPLPLSSLPYPSSPDTPHPQPHFPSSLPSSLPASRPHSSTPPSPSQSPLSSLSSPLPSPRPLPPLLSLHPLPISLFSLSPHTLSPPPSFALICPLTLSSPRTQSGTSKQAQAQGQTQGKQASSVVVKQIQSIPLMGQNMCDNICIVLSKFKYTAYTVDFLRPEWTLMMIWNDSECCLTSWFLNSYQQQYTFHSSDTCN